MMKMKKIVAGILCACLMIQMTPVTGIAGSMDEIQMETGKFIFDRTTGKIMGLNELGEQLEKLVLPNKIGGVPVTGIDAKAFRGYTNLTEIRISANVRDIEQGAFHDCPNLEKIEVAEKNQFYMAEDGVLFTKDGKRLIRCPEKKNGSYIISDRVSVIDSWAFASCNRLTEVNLGRGIHRIGDYAFWGCSGLTKLEIPRAAEKLGKGFVRNCSGLKEIIVSDQNLNYMSENGVLFTSDQHTLLNFPDAKEGFYGVPEEVRRIEDAAFLECGKLTEIFITGNVKDIGKAAFYDCTALKYVTFLEGIHTIGEEAFSGCTELQIINIPASVNSIGKEAFNHCRSLTKIEIPSSVKKIGEKAFHRCHNLLQIIYDGSQKEWNQITGEEKMGLEEDAVILFKKNTPLPEKPHTEEKAISLNRRAANIFTRGQGRSFVLVLRYGNRRVNPREIRWTSSRPAIAGINSSGKVSGRKSGRTLITAVYRGKRYSCRVTVKNPVLKIKKSKLVLKKGKKYRIRYQKAPDFKVSFKSKNKKIAAVTGKGIIRARKQGKTKIKVTGNKMTRYISVTVK